LCDVQKSDKKPKLDNTPGKPAAPSSEMMKAFISTKDATQVNERCGFSPLRSRAECVAKM
jgi:hypothetical protein